MREFSEWIDAHSLVDLQLSGGNFTWSNHQETSTLARLDIFLVSTDWMELYPDVVQLLLPKTTSDHWPVLLDSGCERWGPTPFRFERMWLEETQFSDLIKEWLQEIRTEG